MERKSIKIDLLKLIMFVLKRCWLVIICAVLGFSALYLYTSRMLPDTYTASGTMYVNNGNPNLENYQYTNTNDLDSALKLIDTYMVVVKSEKVMSGVIDRLSEEYPGISAGMVSDSLSMASVSETGVVSVRSTTGNGEMSKDIVNAVLEVAPEEIIRVVGAGNIEIIDYAKVPVFPDGRNASRKGMLGAMAGAVVAGCVLLIMFLMNQKIIDTKDLTDSYTPPVLASIQRIKNDGNRVNFMLSDKSSMEIIENYAKLRMNLLYTLVGKESNTVIFTSAISGEGKSTIAANLAISCGMGSKKVLLIDGDMRRASQKEIFQLEKDVEGLSDVLVGKCDWRQVIIKDVRESLDLMPAGHFPPNPAELLGSAQMLQLLKGLEKEYDLIMFDMPPINVVADPLVLSTQVAGCLFITRQDYSDHRDIRKALIAAEMTGMDVLGFVFYGENLNQGNYYHRKYYKNYYSKYDYRSKHAEIQNNINKG